MNLAPSSGLSIVSPGVDGFVFEDVHSVSVSASFSVSHGSTKLFTVSTSAIAVSVVLNYISVTQLQYLVNNSSHVQDQFNTLLQTITRSVQTLNNTIMRNVNVLNAVQRKLRVYREY